MVDINVLENRVAALEREMSGIAELMTLERRLNESRFAAVLASLDEVKREVQAIPRTLAEMLAERDKR